MQMVGCECPNEGPKREGVWAKQWEEKGSYMGFGRDKYKGLLSKLEDAEKGKKRTHRQTDRQTDRQTRTNKIIWLVIFFSPRQFAHTLDHTMVVH